MRFKRLVSLVASVAMLAGLSITTPLSAQAAGKTVFFSDLTGEDNPIIQASGPLGDKWVALTSYSESNPCSYAVEDGRLYMNYAWNSTASAVEPAIDDWQSVTANSTYSYKMAMANNSVAAKTHTSSWGQYSTIYSRIAVSGDTYYEIGKTGSSDSNRNYPLPISVENGVSTGNANYKYRLYFRKVVKGETVDIIWEDDEDGPYNMSATYGDGEYRRWRSGAVKYNSDLTELECENWINVTATTSSTGINCVVNSVMPGYSSVHPWVIDYQDSEPIAVDGNKINFGVKGHESGMVIDELRISTEVTTQYRYWSDDFNDRTVGPSYGDAGLVFNGDWNFYGSNYESNLPMVIENGYIGRKNWGQRNTGARVNNDIQEEYVKVDSKYMAKLAAYNPGETDLTGNRSDVYMRFNISSDGNSYYEVGITGRHNTALINILGLANEYKYGARYYFRMVENGKQKALILEDDQDGFFAASKNFGDNTGNDSGASYERCQYSKYNLDRWFTVNVTTSQSKIEYSVTAQYKNHSWEQNTSEYTWRGVFTDTSLVAENTGFAVGCEGGEKGFACDEVAIGMPVMAQTATWADEFDDRTLASAEGDDGTPFNGDWYFAGSNYESHFPAAINNGYVMRNGWGNHDSGFSLSDDIAASTTANGKYVAALSSYSSTSSDLTWGRGNIYMRFNVSADKTSYYEIGMSGTQDNAVELLGVNGNEYKARYYIRKVVDGIQTDIIWENDENGFFANSKNFGDHSGVDNDAVYWRAKHQQITNNNWFTVTASTSDANGIAFKVVALCAKNSYSDPVDYTWSGTMRDTELILPGTGVMIGSDSGEKGFACDYVRVTYEEAGSTEEPLYSDNFNKYTENNAITEKHEVTGLAHWGNQGEEYITYKGHRMADGPTAIVTASNGAKWMSSGVYTGGYEYGGNYHEPGFARLNLSRSALEAQGVAEGHIAAVNLDFGDAYKVRNISKITATTGRSARRAGLRLFVSGDETKFIEFGITGGEASIYGQTDGTVNYKFTPYVVKSIPVIDSNEDGKISIRESTETKSELIYQGEDFTEGSAFEGESTVKTTGTWTSSDSLVKWTFEFDNAAGTIAWSAEGNGTGKSSGIIKDADVAALMSANFAYPAALASGGDNTPGSLHKFSIWADLVDYEPVAPGMYTQGQFNELYKQAKYGRPIEVRDLMLMDTSEFETETAEATLAISNTVSNANTLLTGAQIEFSDDWSKYFTDESCRTLRSDYVAFAKQRPPIPSFRFGGTSSCYINMLKSAYHEDSVYVSLPNNITNAELGGVARKAYKMGLLEYIRAMQVNNPDASFVLCMSPYTTTAADMTELLHILRDTSGTYAQTRIKAGIAQPVNIEAIELGNEVDYFNRNDEMGANAYYDSVMEWYLPTVSPIIDAVNAFDSNIKIIACGPTAPWSADLIGRAKNWVDRLCKGYKGAAGIANKIDSMSFHPYYYGIIPDKMLSQYADTLHTYFKTNGYGNVKIAVTEYGMNWEENNAFYSNGFCSSLFAGIADIYFIQLAQTYDFIDSAYEHNIVGANWNARWQMANNKMYEGVLTSAYDVIGNAWGSKVYDSTYTITKNVDDVYLNNSSTSTGTSYTPISYRSTATVVADDNGKVNIIVSNNTGYTPISLNIDLPSELEDYKLTRQVTYTAPNLYSNMATPELSGIASPQVIDYTTPEAFGDCTVKIPSKSVIIYTIEGNASNTLKDDITYSNTQKIGLEYSTTPIIAENANGTKWIGSAYLDGSGAEYYGAAYISNGALVVENVADDLDYDAAVNWDISGFAGDVSDINTITFTLTENSAVGGVRLFVQTDEDEEIEYSDYEFSNSTVGLTGTVNWTITIKDGTLSWVASNNNATKNGSMPISEQDLNEYDYLAQIFAKPDIAGTVSLDSISVAYGAGAPVDSPVTYTDNATSIDVSVNTAIISGKSIVAFYAADGKLINVVIGDNELSATKPASYASAKIMVWDVVTQAPAIEAITLK